MNEKEMDDSSNLEPYSWQEEQQPQEQEQVPPQPQELAAPLYINNNVNNNQGGMPSNYYGTYGAVSREELVEAVGMPPQDVVPQQQEQQFAFSSFAAERGGIDNGNFGYNNNNNNNNGYPNQHNGNQYSKHDLSYIAAELTDIQPLQLQAPPHPMPLQTPAQTPAHLAARDGWLGMRMRMPEAATAGAVAEEQETLDEDPLPWNSNSSFNTTGHLEQQQQRQLQQLEQSQELPIMAADAAAAGTHVATLPAPPAQGFLHLDNNNNNNTNIAGNSHRNQSWQEPLTNETQYFRSSGEQHNPHEYPYSSSSVSQPPPNPQQQQQPEQKVQLASSNHGVAAATTTGGGMGSFENSISNKNSKENPNHMTSNHNLNNNNMNARAFAFSSLDSRLYNEIMEEQYQQDNDVMTRNTNNKNVASSLEYAETSGDDEGDNSEPIPFRKDDDDNNVNDFQMTTLNDNSENPFQQQQQEQDNYDDAPLPLFGQQQQGETETFSQALASMPKVQPAAVALQYQNSSRPTFTYSQTWPNHHHPVALSENTGAHGMSLENSVQKPQQEQKHPLEQQQQQEQPAGSTSAAQNDRDTNAFGLQQNDAVAVVTTIASPGSPHATTGTTSSTAVAVSQERSEASEAVIDLIDEDDDDGEEDDGDNGDDQVEEMRQPYPAADHNLDVSTKKAPPTQVDYTTLSRKRKHPSDALNQYHVPSSSVNADPEGPMVFSPLNGRENVRSAVAPTAITATTIPALPMDAIPSMYRQQQQQLQHYQNGAAVPLRSSSTAAAVNASLGNRPAANPLLSERIPKYMELPEGFRPTWDHLVPDPAEMAAAALRARRLQQQQAMALTSSSSYSNRNHPVGYQHKKAFQLSLLNVNEFTIFGLADYEHGMPCSVKGLRTIIKKIARDHGGKAVFETTIAPVPPQQAAAGAAEMENENDDDALQPYDPEVIDGGKWRIPLAAYHALFAYLRTQPDLRVVGIPQVQLQIASLERARQEKGYPTPEKLIQDGVPARLALALAPFQRGGVDFVLEKEGRALIADDMGLGKTIQGIASMSIYYDEWPLLVLCPSSARYHWEHEFRTWLGAKKDEEWMVRTDSTKTDSKSKTKRSWHLKPDHIHVLTNGKDKLLPRGRDNTKVVICSYGLAPALVQHGLLIPSMFKCAIVDESHMLKNKATKRTSTLLPILQATTRCVLLSGTPALARPIELWPQLLVLAKKETKEGTGWWQSEAEFISKYAKKKGTRNRAELHTMLTGTVMIRRLKNDILKTLPNKRREMASVNVLNETQQGEFKELMAIFRSGRGVLGKIARNQHLERGRDAKNQDKDDDDDDPESLGLSQPPSTATAAAGLQSDSTFQERENNLKQELNEQLTAGKAKIQESIATAKKPLDAVQVQKMEDKLRAKIEEKYVKGMAEIRKEFPEPEMQDDRRKTLLTRLYSLTGNVKIPLIVDMLNRWLDDKTKGKLCVFAHHISVLDALENQCKLSNKNKSKRKFIRIDGKTSPKFRQEQIDNFQSDPSVRIALLGITAAGVAVTLTASSTVWFTELFWTPAIMIQAEDRCHRIGQQAVVKCLYFVAKGTLDEVLWKLIENKFRDLGEFVEGKEKLKLVIDRKYSSIKELHTIFQDDTALDAEDSAADGAADENEDSATEFLLDGTLAHDIEDLAKEEEKMLSLLSSPENDEDDGESDPKDSNADRKRPAKVAVQEEIVLGASEEQAIALSDDEDGNAVDVENAIIPNPMDSAGPTSFKYSRLYKIMSQGSSLGVEIILYNKRVVCSVGRNGDMEKPAVGDILVGVNGIRLPHIEKLSWLISYLRDVLKNPPVELVFLEDTMFAEFFVKHLAEEQERQRQAKRKAREERLAAARQAPPPPKEVVIDLIDD